MIKRQTLVRSTLATALLSAMLLSPSVHAGLLGGAIGVTGGLGGGIAGGTAAGQAAGQLAAQGAFMPRVPDLAQQAGSIKQAGTTHASEQGSVSRERAGNLGADVTGAGMAGANLSRDAAQRAGRDSAMNQAIGTGDATAAGNSGAATSARQADVSVNGSGSAQASRANASVKSDASAQGSVSR